MSVHERMVRVMGALSYIPKERSEGVNYQFRSVDAVFNHLHGLLAEHGLFPSPRVLDDWQVNMIPGTNNRQQTQALFRVCVDMYAVDGTMVTLGPGLAQSHDYGDKAVYQAQQNAIKYVLLEAFCIPTAEQDMDAREADAVPTVDLSPLEAALAEAEPLATDKAKFTAWADQWRAHAAQSVDNLGRAVAEVRKFIESRKAGDGATPTASSPAADQQNANEGAGADGASRDGDASTAGDGADGHDVGRGASEPAPAPSADDAGKADPAEADDGSTAGGEGDGQPQPPATYTAEQLEAMNGRELAAILRALKDAGHDVKLGGSVADMRQRILEAQGQQASGAPAEPSGDSLTQMQQSAMDAVRDMPPDRRQKLLGRWNESDLPDDYPRLDDKQCSTVLAWVDELGVPF